MKIKLGISLSLAFLAFLFIYQNTEMVVVDFFVWSVQMSLVLLVFIILGTGIIIGWLSNSFLRFSRNRKQIKGQENQQTQDDATQQKADVVLQGDQERHE